MSLDKLKQDINEMIALAEKIGTYKHWIYKMLYLVLIVVMIIPIL